MAEKERVLFSKEVILAVRGSSDGENDNSMDQLHQRLFMGLELFGMLQLKYVFCFIKCLWSSSEFMYVRCGRASLLNRIWLIVNENTWELFKDLATFLSVQSHLNVCIAAEPASYLWFNLLRVFFLFFSFLFKEHHYCYCFSA